MNTVMETGRTGMGEPAGRDGTKPLLIDTITGEDRGIEFGRLGQALVLLGGVALLIYTVSAFISAPALNEGWESVWFLPGSQFDFIAPLALGAVVVGLVLYLLGRPGHPRKKSARGGK